MLLETNLNDGLKAVIEKNFGKNIEKYDPLKTDEVFFVVYKVLAVLLKRDFNARVEMVLDRIKVLKVEDIKQPDGIIINTK